MKCLNCCKDTTSVHYRNEMHWCSMSCARRWASLSPTRVPKEILDNLNCRVCGSGSLLCSKCRFELNQTYKYFRLMQRGSFSKNSPTEEQLFKFLLEQYTDTKESFSDLKKGLRFIQRVLHGSGHTNM